MSSNQKEYSGKNIEEAIAAACADLTASQAELEIEVVSAGSAGIFGIGRKKAIILAARKEVVPTGQAVDKPRGGRPAARPKPPAFAANREPAGKPKSAGRRETRSSSPEAEGGQAPSLTVQNDIKELLATLLRLMGLSAEVTISAVGSKVTALIIADNEAEDIIGRDGSTLDALQYLMRKIVAQKFPGKITLDLDAGSYREDRQRELQTLALELASKVKETGKSQMTGALNPAERRIVHLTLQDDTAIRSASIGDGLFKKVKISLPGQGRRQTSPHGRGRRGASKEIPQS